MATFSVRAVIKDGIKMLLSINILYMLYFVKYFTRYSALEAILYKWKFDYLVLVVSLLKLGAYTFGG